MLRVRRLVHRVVTGNPLVVFIVLRELFPEPDQSILEVFVNPEVRNVCPGIRVPVGVLSFEPEIKSLQQGALIRNILTSWCRVAINDRVNALPSADVDNAIEVLETFWFEHTRVHIIYFRM